MILEFRDDKKHIHHQDVVRNLLELRVQNPDNWLEEKEKIWRCRCGTPYSWYEETCSGCGGKLISYKNYLSHSS
jgi:rRNA maturation endonuclease Nob1